MMNQMMATEKFSPVQLETLRREFSTIQTASVDVLPRFHKLFDGCNDQALKQLAFANIKFVSKLAVNACIRRGLELC